MALSSRHTLPTHEHCQGRVQIYSTEVTEKDFIQPRLLWDLIQKEGAQEQFMENICPTFVDLQKTLRRQVCGKFKILRLIDGT